MTKKAKKGKKSSMSKKSGMSKKSSMSSSGEGTTMTVWCVHERKKSTMVNGHKKEFTMKNGNKRAMMIGECKNCHKKVTQFVKL